MRVRLAGIVPIEDGFAFMHRVGVQNHPIGDYYTFPGGGKESGETIEEGTIREIKEEFGIDVEVIKKLYEIEKQKQDSEVANARKSQVGSGDRSEKIRTYNYPQGRITDHRIGMSIFQMENFLNGDIDEMIDNLIAADRAERLKGDE